MNRQERWDRYEGKCMSDNICTGAHARLHRALCTAPQYGTAPQLLPPPPPPPSTIQFILQTSTFLFTYTLSHTHTLSPPRPPLWLLFKSPLPRPSQSTPPSRTPVLDTTLSRTARDAATRCPTSTVLWRSGRTTRATPPMPSTTGTFRAVVTRTGTRCMGLLR